MASNATRTLSETMTDSDDTSTTRTPQPAQPPPPGWAPPESTAPPPPAPAWRPRHEDRGRNTSLFFGVLILLVGLWYFASRTLGLDMPRLDWNRLWPIFVIGLGAWIVLVSIRRPR